MQGHLITSKFNSDLRELMDKLISTIKLGKDRTEIHKQIANLNLQLKEDLKTATWN